MLKKRFMAIILAVLSFFVLSMPVSAFDIRSIFGGEEEQTEQNLPRLKMYMPSAKMDPVSVSGGGDAKAAGAILYDGKTDTAAAFEGDTSVTVDMGMSVLLSYIRYYAGKIEDDANNCLGARFYASNDNRTFTELAVIEEAVPPENGWFEITFSGFGEYRYFRVVLPHKSNICEIEWMGAKGFSKTKSGGKYDVAIALCAFEGIEDINATVLMAAYNKNGIAKQMSVAEQKIPANTVTDFVAELKGTDYEDGDSYRVAVFEEDGNIPLEYPLEYKINGAASNLQVSSVFGDNMVLQADKPAVIWGKAPVGQSVQVSIENSLGGGITKEVMPDKNSRWEVSLGSFSAGGNYTLTVKSGRNEQKYINITFGDVWLCTGQSNMEYYMAGSEETLADLENAEEVRNENIRLLNLWNKGMTGAANPVDNPPTGGDSWHEMDADVAAYSSAVGYYFANEIQETTGEPVGIINVAVGDTEINRWIAKGTKCQSFTSTDGDLYNNRIYPFEKLNIKGIILYQGEADQYRTHLSVEEYSDAMAGLVDNYRENWGVDLPFYWAQLTRYRVDESLVREGQRVALSKVSEKKNTGMISLIDIVGNYEDDAGNARNDIHPWGKKIVAERFAAYAKRDCYGQNVAVTGPVYKSAEVKGDKMVLTFECEGKLRVMPKERYADKETDDKIKKEKLDTSKPMEFEVAGADGRFYAAEATLDGKTVILKSDEVDAPVYARYAWGAYPEMPNLTDDTGLPAATFTTEYLG